ncbi:MAG: HAD family phosphatase [Candidatus Marsarchaeota archaeon]|jgi:epoxide hydrolase-like predicted phosphatase|nr:HAD family phosphatase [Candidatus Marsarchaeota archaeon]
MVIKAIIFDVGGVIIDFSEKMYINWLSKKEKIDKIELTNFLNNYINKMESGSLLLKDVGKAFTKKFHKPESSFRWIEGFRENAKANEEVVNLMKSLSNKYDIGIITNVSYSRYKEFRKILFDKLVKEINIKTIVASCYVKTVKPDEKIYEIALKRLEVQPDEAVFIDNLKENVEGAAKVGIHAIQYTDYEKLLEDLVKLDVELP